ncbi:MAG: hypothetical protein DRJ15_10765 [Bacteroidetes bacterium]|nr:MAG: hypothetical protein DRJ15_10765 [Bacteroidota bacterium]
METKIICPLGSQCETAKTGFIERCAWFVQIEGVSSNSGETVNESRCAMAWMPLLQIETTTKTIGVNEAICKAKEENIKRQDMAIQLELSKLQNNNHQNLLEIN